MKLLEEDKSRDVPKKDPTPARNPAKEDPPEEKEDKPSIQEPAKEPVLQDPPPAKKEDYL